jgi:large subunit ribosomal protein L21
MYAVIATGGKQERVEVGSRIEVELLPAAVGDAVEFPAVLLVDGSDVVSARSELAGASVSGRVLGESKGPKIVGFTYKKKTRGRRHYGHRQHYTTVEITGIAPAGPSSSAGATES